MLMFFELIQVALGVRERLSRNPTPDEWRCLFEMAQKQAVAAFLFDALERLSRQGLRPPEDVLFEWIGIQEETKYWNRSINRTVVKLSELLKQDGFLYTILKGQGNALLYPNPLSRQPGDIDVWIRDRRRKKENIGYVIRYVKTKNPQARAVYHHIDYGIVDGVEVEVHYRPSFMFNPLHNRRLQQWFVEHAEEQFIHRSDLPEGLGTISVPTPEFNVVFQLSHVYNHLLHEGVGLRQIIDYYFLLKSGNNNQLKTENDKLLKYLGLEQIAGAMMWVLHEKLGLQEKYLIAPKDEKRGKALLNEMMKGGNFGFYDVENQRANNRFKKGIQRCRRDLRMVRYFPSECLWEPLFRIYHLFWRIRYNRVIEKITEIHLK